MKNFLLILGTAREENMSQRVHEFVLNTLKNNTKIMVTPLYVNDFLSNKTQGLNSDHLETYKNMISSHDGLIIVSPEYNHGYPGELKLLLDNAYTEYNGKPAAICGVSDGALGGSRMAEQLKLVLSAFQMTIINSAVYFSNVKENFLDDGTINNMDFYMDRINGMVDSMLKYSK